MVTPINIQKTGTRELDDIIERKLSLAYESNLFYIRQTDAVSVFFILLSNSHNIHDVYSTRISSISDPQREPIARIRLFIRNINNSMSHSKLNMHTSLFS